MEQGASLTVYSYALDGTLERKWPATVEACEGGMVRVFSPKGTRCGGPKGGWAFQADLRGYYWSGRSFNLLEGLGEPGNVEEIYIHIASEPEMSAGGISYTDYELDIVQKAGGVPRLVDVEEFYNEVERLSLPPEFQASCYQAVADALNVLALWSLCRFPSRNSLS